MRNCEYILDAIYKLKEFEDDTATRNALSAAIIAMTDEHLRHSGEDPWLEFSVLDQVAGYKSSEDDEPDDDRMNCQVVPASVLDASQEISKRAALEVLNRLSSPLLKHL